MQITLNIFQALLMKTNKHKQTNKITSHFQFLLRLNRLKFQGGNSFQVQNKLGLHNFSKLQSCTLKNFDCDRSDEYSTEQNSKVFDHQCKSDHQSPSRARVTIRVFLDPADVLWGSFVRNPKGRLRGG